MPERAALLAVSHRNGSYGPSGLLGLHDFQCRFEFATAFGGCALDLLEQHLRRGMRRRRRTLLGDLPGNGDQLGVQSRKAFNR